MEYNVPGGVVVSVTDSLFNVTKTPDSFIGRCFAKALDNLTDGQPQVGLLGRLFMHDRTRVAEFFDECATRDDVVAVVMAHGDVARDARAAFAAAARKLRGSKAK